MSLLTGRQAEIAAVERFLERVPVGPVGLVLSGEPGIGKTVIWREAVRLAAERGFRVLQASPAEPERQLSFAGLGDLLRDSFSEVGETLPAPQREALLAALLRTRARAPIDPRAIATGLTSLLSTLAAERPVVVAIDDAQWLDRASERALEFALRRLPDRSAVLVAIRSDAQPMALDVAAAIGRDAIVELRIGPLPVAELQRVIGARGPAPSRSTMARLAAASGGNPLYALELAGALGDTDLRPGEPLPVPAVLLRLVRDRVARLSPAAHEIAAMVAASFRPTQAVIQAALGPGAEVEPSVVEAEEAGVLEWDGDRLRFAHPLLGSALYGSLSTGRRRAIHRRLADVAGEPEERAHHLAGAIAGEDEGAAAEVEAAAAIAADRGAADAAANLHQVAERLTPRHDLDARARRLVRAAEALATAGDFPGARSLAQRSRSVASSGPLRARAWLVEASIATYFGSTQEQSAALDAALLEAGDDPPARMQALLALAEKIAIDPEGAAHFAEEAVRAARAMGDAASLRRGLMHLVVASAILGRGDRRDLFEEAAALEAKAPSFGVDSLIWSHWIDDVAGTRRRHDVQLRLARDQGDMFAVAEIAEFLAMTDFREGNWDAAESSLEAACTTLEPFGISGPVIASFTDRSIVDAHRGRLDRARGTLRALLETRPAPDPFWTAVCLSALGSVEFVAGDARAADAAWSAMGHSIRSVGWLDFLEDRSEPDHVEVLVGLGERDRAREVLDHLEWRGRTLPRPWIEAALPRARAIVTAADGDLDEGLAAIQACGETPGFPFEQARNRMVQGQLERRANRRLAARRSLVAALEIFERLGSPPWADRTRAEIQRLGLRHRSANELTAMEQRIAELTATGLTNRQVADAAFVSPKTVEASLSRVYSKLGIRSRAELGARMGAASRAVDTET